MNDHEKGNDLKLKSTYIENLYKIQYLAYLKLFCMYYYTISLHDTVLKRNKYYVNALRF